MAMLGRLVVGLSLFSRTCMAAACGGNDAQIWSQKGSAAFSSDMETCGRQCALASTSCASDCVKGKEGYSDGCAACFGEVFGCTRDHCKLKCIAGQTAECKACVEAAGCAANFTACSGFTAPSARMPQLMDDFTGSDAPSVPVCYAGSAKELGMKETVQVKVDTFSNNQGTMDLKGSGAETINCLGKTFTKNGCRQVRIDAARTTTGLPPTEEISTDLSDCCPKLLKLSDVKYCSDQDVVIVKAKVAGFFEQISLQKASCGNETIVV
ncbi:Kinesin-like protein KIF3A [Durusdinium trenchii]|uniref:Kinesin-like protein KIF3A n=1 Tax=Durusdinium trenchii TaxID=1381693 RepID=A0ABP0K4Q9_9DINO